MSIRLTAALLVSLATALPTSALADAGALARIVGAMAPSAVPVAGGFRFTVEGVAVSVLGGGSDLVRVVARAGELTERDVRLVVSALGPDLLPDPSARVVSVRGLVCSAVLARLDPLTEAGLREVVAGAVQVAREAASAPDPAAAVTGGGFARPAAPVGTFRLEAAPEALGVPVDPALR
jgi:hypothetical protein